MFIVVNPDTCTVRNFTELKPEQIDRFVEQGWILIEVPGVFGPIHELAQDGTVLEVIKPEDH